ncbi:MAG: thioredoxin family protein [Elusimicrobiota bacterium]
MIFRLLMVLLAGVMVSACKIQKNEQTAEQPAAKAQEVIPISWVYNLDEGLKSAKTAQKPLMVDFYTDWCGWCKKLDRDVYTDARIIKLSEGFVCVKVDAEKYPADAQKYGVNGYPTIVFLKPDGTALDKIAGYAGAKEFGEFMSKIKND